MTAGTVSLDTGLTEAKRRLLQKILSGGTGRVPGQGTDAVTPRASGVQAPISLEQQNVWLHASMAPAQPLYNEAITIHRRGAFDLRILEKSFNALLHRHEAWRTSFRFIEGEVVPVVHDDLDLRLPLVDLTALPVAEREAEALRLATQDAHAPIDLMSPPLFRAQVFKLAEDDHRLHLTLHHIIFDGVSIYRIIVPELSSIYDALAAGKEPVLPAPRLQYGDYAVWRERQASGAAIERQMAYWRETLGGELPLLQLPTDRPRPLRLSYHGSMETFSLPGTLTEALKASSRKEGLTLYMTLLAAFKALLHRYSGQEDMIIGGVTDTRRRPELQNVVGYFLNSLTLRTRPSSALPFRDYLGQVRDAVVGALSASDAPFDRIVREIQPKRDLGAHPLFQVLFSVEPPAPEFAAGWDLTQMDVTVGAAKFDLYLELDERPEGLIGRFLYSTELFEAATIRRMIGHWRTMLEGIVADASCEIGRLPILTAEEKNQLLVTWNNTEADIPATTLHGFFEAQARRSPDAVAAVCGTKAWTYRELDSRATAVARRLRAQGVKPGTVVAICLKRSLDMVAGLLAILKAGGVYLPLDPSFPKSRLDLIVDDARPAVLLTQRSIAKSLQQSRAQIVLVDEDISSAFSGGFAPAAVGAENLAYLIYTSGSTGKPKGVAVSHLSAVNLLSAMAREPGCHADDALLAVTTLSFDIAALELFLPLVTGGRVIVAEKDDVQDARRLSVLIERSGCTIMQATPATWRALIATGWAGKRDLKILCGGEALPRDLAGDLLSRSAELWNMYGPTETTIWSTVQKVERTSGPVAIGRPIANTRIYILDRTSSPLPVGVIGELCIGGVGVAFGYHNRDDLTRARFIDLSAVPGERVYRTGDLARYRPDGTIECLGRNDQQVKIRGFRIELEDVESALGKYPAIAAAAVKAWPDTSRELSLCAYLVKRPGHDAGVAEIRQFLRQMLPDYMVPSRYVWMASLPMTPNAKLDRNRLAMPDESAPRLAFAAPRDTIERELAEIWKGILGIDSVGAHDDFFNLGGHSLLAAKLLRQIEVRFSQRLPITAVFQTPTLDAMAALLRNPATATAKSRVLPIQSRGARPPLFWLNDAEIVRPLAAAIGKDQPFLGVALDAEEERMLSGAPRLANITARLIKTIRSEQPHGPYYLGGWCTSGILAFEVASQLKAQGADVGLVILLHSANPAHFGMRQKLALEFGRLRHGLVKSFGLPGSDKWRFAAERVMSNISRIARERKGALLADTLPSFSEVLDRAAIVYSPAPYDGNVALFQPSIRPRALDYRWMWSGIVTGQFTSHDVMGTHYTMLEAPYVQELGRRMNAALHQAQNMARMSKRLAG